jgi:hypothetical protein
LFVGENVNVKGHGFCQPIILSFEWCAALVLDSRLRGSERSLSHTTRPAFRLCPRRRASSAFSTSAVG